MLSLLMPLLLAAGPTLTPSEEAIHQELRALKADMEKAMNARDVEGIVARLDDAIVFTTMNGDVRHGKDAIRAYFHEMLDAPNHPVEDVKVSFEVDRLTTLYGDGVGVATGASKDHYRLTDGMEIDIAARWTCTMVKKDGRWLIAAFHYSTNMFDNPVLSALKRVSMWIGIGAGVFALVLGIVAGRVTKR